jgi:hypothetical protein
VSALACGRTGRLDGSSFGLTARRREADHRDPLDNVALTLRLALDLGNAGGTLAFGTARRCG